MVMTVEQLVERESGRANRSTRRKLAPVPLCPQHNPYYLTRTRFPVLRGGQPATNLLSYVMAKPKLGYRLGQISIPFFSYFHFSQQYDFFHRRCPTCWRETAYVSLPCCCTIHTPRPWTYQVTHSLWNNFFWMKWWPWHSRHRVRALSSVQFSPAGKLRLATWLTLQWPRTQQCGLTWAGHTPITVISKVLFQNKCCCVIPFSFASVLHYQFKSECRDRLWNGVHSALVRVNEELLETKVAAPV
jgi:hypothetical protein